ncbi:hypothetical protein LEMLEM_LOCUS8961 [Lemmus lemmus]
MENKSRSYTNKGNYEKGTVGINQEVVDGGSAVKPYKVGRDAPGEARRGGGRRQVFDSIPSTVTAPLAKRKETKIHPRNQPGRTRSGGPTGARGGRGSEANTVPLAPQAVTSPPGLPRRSRRPHARTSPTSRGRLPWRLAASPEAALNGCRSQSTTPRRGTSSPPAAPGSPATPPVSREAGGRERARGRGRRKGGAANGGGHLCAASGGAAAIVLRSRLLCCPRGLRPSTPGEEEEEEAVWLR